MAEAFDVAASARAFAELSAKVISLCSQYSQAAGHANVEIERVIEEVTDYEALVEELQDLLDSPRGATLRASQGLWDALEGGQSQLKVLLSKLTPGETHRAMARVSPRGLEWPLESDEVENILQELARCRRLVTTETEPRGVFCFTNEKVIALKQELLADDYPLTHSCRHCSKFAIPVTLPPGDEIRYFLRLSEKIDDIHTFAAAGCRWYLLFSDAIRSSRSGLPTAKVTVEWHWPPLFERQLLDDDSIFISLYYNMAIYPVSIVAQLDTPTIRYLAEFIPLKKPDASNYPGSRSIGSPINTNPGSEKSIQLIRSWIEACSTQHSCGIHDLPPVLPNFLLAVGEEHIRLIDTTGKNRGRYVALSYCWGLKGYKTKLSEGNKQQLLRDIPFENLDPTIQDAINITKEAGFQYLWVDALCIVQDNDEAKQQELAHMHDIYRHATITLIPSRAEAVQDGFLSTREVIGGPQPDDAFKLQYLDNGDAASNSTVILVPMSITLSQWRYRVEPWLCRAWTLQEGLISKRCLQFGNQQTTWSCHHNGMQYRDSDGWCSVPYRSSHGYSAGDNAILSRASTIIHQTRLNHRHDDRNIWDAWEKVLEEFMQRKITYHGDRLPAISSIAKEFAEASNDDYICGLWKSNLHRGLLWRRYYWAPRESPTKPDFIPSWSWAMALSQIEHPHGYLFKDGNFQLLKYHVLPRLGGDKYGIVKSASLCVRGLVTSVPEAVINDSRADLVGLSRSFAKSNPDYYYRESRGIFGLCEHTALVGWRGSEQDGRVKDLSDVLVGTCIHADDPEVVDPHEEHPKPYEKFSDLSLLVVGHEKYEMHPLRGPCGLIIAKQDNGTYRRLGTFSVGNIWGLSPLEASSSRHGYAKHSHPLQEEYKSRVEYLWGGKDNVREITLV